MLLARTLALRGSVIFEFWSEPSRVSIKLYTDAEGVYGERNRVQIIVLVGGVHIRGPSYPFPNATLDGG